VIVAATHGVLSGPAVDILKNSRISEVVVGLAAGYALGYRHPGQALLAVFASRPEAQAMLAATLQAPTVYDAFLRYLARRGHPVPPEVLERDVSQAWVEAPALIGVYKAVYEDTDTYWAEYAACEDLVDLEDAFQLWRFRHLRTVQRTIGFKPGTGGSSGVAFLRRALDLTFFPEIYSVRTEIGA
jgi:tryptophan 2,3-dioxygenase